LKYSDKLDGFNQHVFLSEIVCGSF